MTSLQRHYATTPSKNSSLNQKHSKEASAYLDINLQPQQHSSMHSSLPIFSLFGPDCKRHPSFSPELHVRLVESLVSLNGHQILSYLLCSVLSSPGNRLLRVSPTLPRNTRVPMIRRRTRRPIRLRATILLFTPTIVVLTQLLPRQSLITVPSITPG